MSAATTPDLKPYHYPAQYRHLLDNVAEHQMELLHSDGLYRHLRFQRPGTALWHWDLLTWPGSLAIRGDIGEGLIFTRERDMLAFFDHEQPDGHINPSYWAEKLDLGCRSVKEFSGEKFQAWLRAAGPFDRLTTVNLWVDVEAVESAEHAVAVLDDYGIDWDVDDPESWQDYRYHFILALHATLWGAKRYHAEVSA